MDAAHEFANATLSALKLSRGIHPPTVIAASARMAGPYLFRSFGLRLPGVLPGHVVLSEAASEQAPLLIQIAVNTLARIGIRIANSPPAPDADADAKSKPMLGFLDTQRKLESVYAPIRAKCGLTAGQAAQGAAVATALLIRHCAKAVDPNLAFGIAVYGFIEGSKTAPESVEAPQDAA